MSVKMVDISAEVAGRPLWQNIEPERYLPSKEDPTFFADLNGFLLKQGQIKALMTDASANLISYFSIQIFAFN